MESPTPSLRAPDAHPQATHRFGDFELCIPGHELRHAGEVLDVVGKPWDLLCYFVSRPGRFFSKQQLLDAVWGCAVDDTNVRQAVRSLRRTCGWSTTWPIRAIRGGYRFDAAVTGPDAPAHHAEAKAPQAIFGCCSRPSQNFVGRQRELDLLATQLTTTRSASIAISASIEGLAGIGKTELALQLVHGAQVGGRFPGGIFWLDAEQVDLTAQWGTSIADTYGIAGSDPRERCLQLLRELGRSAQPVLIVLDNVVDWDEHQPHPLPKGNHVCLLATSRRRRLGGNAFHHLELFELAPSAARELLVRTGGPNADDGSDALLDYLGGHALAIELAGAYLAYGDDTADAYLSFLRRGCEARAAASEPDQSHSLQRVFASNWARLGEYRQRAWILAACFAPEPVCTTFSAAVGLSQEMLRGLGEWHLLRTHAGHWSMHRLTRAFGRSAGPAHLHLETRRQFVLGCHRALQEVGAIEYENGLRTYAPHRVHLEAALELLETTVVDAEVRYEVVSGVAKGRFALGDYAGARSLLERTLAQVEARDGMDSPSLAATASNLAWVLQASGLYAEACVYAERALDANLRALGVDHPTVARDRWVLSWIVRHMGDLTRARELGELALAVHVRELGDEHRDVARDRVGLALVLLALGELSGAKRLSELALQANLKTLPDHHPDIAKIRVILAWIHRRLGELDRARSLLELAVTSDIQNLGEEHPHVARSRSALAMVLRDLGRSADARRLLRQALISTKGQLEPDHPEVTMYRANLALVLRDLGRTRQARSLLLGALQSNLRNHHEGHPHVARVRAHLATLDAS